MTTPLANPRKLFPLFITPKLAETRAFYVGKLGWTATYDVPGYLQVRRDAPDSPEIAFMTPDAAPGPGELPSFPGAGVHVSVPVVDADRHYLSAREQGLQPQAEPALKPWGWRSYTVADPNGVMLDFFHVAAPPSMPPN